MEILSYGLILMGSFFLSLSLVCLGLAINDFMNINEGYGSSKNIF